MRVVTDRNKCQGIGQCESLVPEVFEIDDAGQVTVHEEAVASASRAALDNAVRSCPTEALRLVLDDDV